MSFYVYNTFFRYIVNAYIVILVIKTTSYKSIDKFKAWIT